MEGSFSLSFSLVSPDSISSKDCRAMRSHSVTCSGLERLARAARVSVTGGSKDLFLMGFAGVELAVGGVIFLSVFITGGNVKNIFSTIFGDLSESFIDTNTITTV